MGLIGVGTMGSALALNIAEHGHDVILWNLDLAAVDGLIASAGDLALRLVRCDTIEALVVAVPVPRATWPFDHGGWYGCRLCQRCACFGGDMCKI
tara:strand:+ start:366 stop:650 length:285 start_codon:yes stop_codon:yes gene_type:complete